MRRSRGGGSTRYVWGGLGERGGVGGGGGSRGTGGVGGGGGSRGTGGVEGLEEGEGWRV